MTQHAAGNLLQSGSDPQGARMRSIVITGVSGAGKTTLAMHVARELGLGCRDYADLMLEVSPSVPNKDALQYLDTDTRRAIYHRVDGLLDRWLGIGSPDTGTMLLENHLSILQDGKIVTWPAEGYRRYNARGLVVVHADSDTIQIRRTADPTRNRRPDSVEEITAQQEVNLAQAWSIAAHLNTPLLIVENDLLGEAADRLVAWIKGLPA